MSVSDTVGRIARREGKFSRKEMAHPTLASLPSEEDLAVSRLDVESASEKFRGSVIVGSRQRPGSLRITVHLEAVIFPEKRREEGSSP